MTSIGPILDEFFSPWSQERLWVMRSQDAYTELVRRWRPLRVKVNQAKDILAANCYEWQQTHRTTRGWRPSMTDPPRHDPNAWGARRIRRRHPPRIGLEGWSYHPPGTDPTTCGEQFFLYANTGGPLFGIESDALHYCAIGSFGIYVTLDEIDCTNRIGTMRIVMYNNMSRRSFGDYARYASLSGQANQYMWWIWTETASWNAAGRRMSEREGGGDWGQETPPPDPAEERFMPMPGLFSPCRGNGSLAQEDGGPGSIVRPCACMRARLERTPAPPPCGCGCTSARIRARETLAMPLHPSR
jgi:hypothetical protein